MTIKMLSIDIETGPAQVWTFQMWKPVLSHKHIIESSRMICFSAQWEDEQDKPVMFFSEHHHGRKMMLDQLWHLLDEADVVVHYNGKKFDMPWIEGEFWTSGMTPPSPVKQLDLYQVIKSSSRLLSNKLDYVAERILDDSKETNSGLPLWIACMNGEDAAWEEMKTYAMKDTALLFPIYYSIRPFIKIHPNVSIYSDKAEVGRLACTRCDSENYKKNGFSYTNAARYQRYRCLDCGGHFSGFKRTPLGDSR